jgi:hypothetical protein
MSLLLLLVLVPLLFLPRCACHAHMAEAGAACFARPRWILLACLVPVVAVERQLDVLDWCFLAVAIAQTVRADTEAAALRGAVWIAGPVLQAALDPGVLPGWIVATLRDWWWAPFPLLCLHAWSQRIWPGWDAAWSTSPPAFDPAWFGESTNAAQVAAALRGQGMVEGPGGAFVPSALGNSSYLAEVLAAVAVAAPWPVAAGAVATMVLLKARVPFVAAVIGLYVARRWTWGALAVLLGAGVALARYPYADSLRSRRDTWERVRAVIREHPVGGVGTGRFREAVRQGPLAGEPGYIAAVHTAHSEPLERAAEWGIPGAVVFCAWASTRALRNPGALALAVTALAGHGLHQPVGWWLFNLLAGMGR